MVTALFGYTWLVPCETAAVSAHLLYTPYDHAQVCNSVILLEATYEGCIIVCLACNQPCALWQNDRDLLRTTVVTRGWNGYRNKSQYKKVHPGYGNYSAVPAGDSNPRPFDHESGVL